MGVLILAGQSLTAALLNQYYSFADANATTVTAASAANLSSVYTIPGGEPVAGESTYGLWCGGNGAWGSTPQTLELTFALNGSGVGVGQVVGSSCFSASAAFRWAAHFSVTCATTGSGGTWFGSLNALITQTANNVIPGTAANNTVPVADGNLSAHTAATNAPITVALQAAWGSTTGAPTITNRWTRFAKTA
jgi:hypothetical protein